MSAANAQAVEQRPQGYACGAIILAGRTAARRRTLETAGFRVLAASDRDEVLQLARTAAPSLVVIESGAADISQVLRSSPETASIPIVWIAPQRGAAADPNCDATLPARVGARSLITVIRCLIRAEAAERRAARSEENYRQVVETALEGIWSIDVEGRIQFVNSRMADMLQYRPEELLGLCAWDLAADPDCESPEAAFRRRIAADAPDRFDLPLRRRDGAVLWVSGSGRSWYDGKRKPVLRTEVLIDITERKNAQDKLAESEERLKLALDVAELATWEMELTTRAVSASPLARAIFHLGSGDSHVEDWLAHVHPEDRNAVAEALDAAISGAPYDIQFRVVAPGGATRWIHGKVRGLRDSQGRITRLLGVAQDITRQVEAGAARESQRELLQAIVDNIPAMLCVYDPQLRSFEWNPEGVRVLGWTNADGSNGDFLAKLYPDPASRAKATAYMQSLTPGWREFHTTAKSGEQIPCEWANIRLSGDRLLGIAIDIRERKRAQESLRHSEAKLRARAMELQAIMDALPVAVFVARDPQCRVVIGSRRTYELLRLRQGSNMQLSGAGSPSSRGFRFVREGREIPPKEWPAQRAASTGQEIHDYEFDIVFDDGARRNMLGHAVPLLDDEGHPTGAVAAFLDITDRKEAEEQLRQAQKLESLGTLAAGIAHDFNNLLTAIIGNTSFVIDEVEPAPAKRLRSVLQSAERGANLIRQLLTYCGQAETAALDVDVAHAISDLRELMEFSVPKSVRLHFDLDQRLPRLQMDPSQLEQVLVNLVINAGEAIGDGNPGAIRVSATTATVEKAFVDALGSHTQPGRYLQIEVGDTGHGIEPESLPKLFDPFFSTKFSGRGLGLAAVAGIVRSHRGAIMIDTVPGSGTTFSIFLRIGTAPPELGDQEPGKTSAVVLVVDDDECVREFIAATAARSGYRVLTACDGVEAIEACGRARIDVVVVDVIMPLMGANTLLPQLRKLQPDARILLTSGYSESDARRLCAAYPDIVFLQKPYTAAEIGNAIAELAGASGERGQ